MRARWRVLIVVVMCFAMYHWLNSSADRPKGLPNEAQTIPAGAAVPVFGFYDDSPTLVTVEGKGCRTRVTSDCWGPEGLPDVPSELQPSKTLMQVNQNGEDVPYEKAGRYRAIVACTNSDCRGVIHSQRVVVGRRFVSCLCEGHPHSVFLWSNALRNTKQPFPSGDFSAAIGEFHFTYIPGDSEAVRLCASNPHAWFIPIG
jgi:hypothetical protein